MGKFIIFKGNNQDYYYHLKADNGEKILHGEGYRNHADCVSAIASVKKNSPYYERYEKKTAINNQYYFILKASNGFTIGIGEQYTSWQNCDNGINLVIKHAPISEVYNE